MAYNCEILADSINQQGDRITTMKITFPRMMLAELNTHRMFSRNSASSRAIPFKKMVKMVEENPFIPIAWQKSHSGMQGTEYFTEKEDIYRKEQIWRDARRRAVDVAKDLHSSEVTKQLCNRLLEPFMWHTVIVSATEFSNFFKLRCPEYVIEDSVNSNQSFRSKKDLLKVFKDADEAYVTTEDWLQINQSQADIHIQAIAELMWDAMNKSTPKELKDGEWHIPFGDNINEIDILSMVDNFNVADNLYGESTQAKWIEEYKIKIAIARCARISYQTLGDNPKIDYEADIKLHDMLLTSGHFSPFEHVARAMSDEEYDSYFQGRSYVNQNGPNYEKENEYWSKNGKGWCRNFKGFIQYRSLVDNKS